MLRLRALAILATLFCAGSVHQAVAQTPATGLYDFGSFDNRGFDSINIGNLNIHFEIPLVSKPGRGLNFDYSMVYDGLLWTPSGVSGSQNWVPGDGFGFRGQLSGSVYAGYVTYSTLVGPSCRVGSRIVPGSKITNWVYHDPYGKNHRFNFTHSFCVSTDDVYTGDGSTSDGSGFFLGPDAANGNLDGYVHGRNGLIINAPQNPTAPSASSIIDSNGNTINNDGNGTFTDTLGTTALTIGGNGTASSPRTFTYNVAQQADSSTTATATMSYATYTIQTNFGCSGVSEYGPMSVDLPDRITLADGTYYQFGYESTPGVGGTVTGRLASVTLPTGGTISYNYSAGCGNGLNADGTTGSLNRVTSDGTRLYGRSPSTNGSVTTLQDEAGNQTLYTFTNTNDSFFETHRQVYQGTAGNSTPLLDQQTCYNGATSSCDGAAITQPFTQTLAISSLNGGPSQSTQRNYNGRQLLSSVVENDFNSNGGGTLRTTTYAYVTAGVDKPTAISVSDGASHSISSVTFGYDEQTPTSTSGIPQHSAAIGPRGNQTSSHVVVSGGYFDRTAAYYDTGAPVSSTDPNGTTQYSYDPTQGFATQTTPPTPSSGVSLPTSASYDVASGIQFSASDVNNTGAPMVQYAQYDKLLRPRQINTVDGNQTTYTYFPGGPGNSAMTNIATNPGSNTSTNYQYDGYGRVSRVGTYNGQATGSQYQTDYCYDATGHLSFQSILYQGDGFGSTPKRCSGSGATYTYDALGRVTNTSTSDGNTTYRYNSRATLITDVNTVQKIIQRDAFGRTTAVCELSTESYKNDSPADCGLDIAGAGYLTTYSYDLANHRTTVNQGTQQRIFQTDSLGRTIYVKEPESGETQYSYSYNSYGLQVVRTRPRANQTQTNITTDTTTQYDKVGRLIWITYTDGTPERDFIYDMAGGWINNPQTYMKGRLALAYRTPGTPWQGTAFSYDTMGRITSLTERLPSGVAAGSTYDRLLGFTYDMSGNLKTVSDGGGITVSYSYTPASEITQIISSLASPIYPSTLVSNVQQTPNGPSQFNLGNGLNVFRVFDAIGRTQGEWVCIGPGSVGCGSSANQVHGYYVGWKGNQAQLTAESSGNLANTNDYDALNRLSSSTDYYSHLPLFNYVYDRYGNRWEQNPQSGWTGVAPAPSYSFNNANQIVGYSYDAAGNLLFDGFHHYTYDAEGNVIQVDSGSTATYTYNALNQRIRVDQGTASSEFLYNALGKRVSIWDANTHNQTQSQVYWGGTPIAFYRGNQIHFQHQDWLGNERVRSDYIGSTEATFTALPFGDGFSKVGPDDDDYHVAGLDHDVDDTHHAMFRQYSSTQGRWMSPDPYMGSYDGSDPQTFNRYSYVGNSPLAFTDPSGLKQPSVNLDDNDLGFYTYGNGYSGTSYFGQNWDPFASLYAFASSDATGAPAVLTSNGVQQVENADIYNTVDVFNNVHGGPDNGIGGTLEWVGTWGMISESLSLNQTRSGTVSNTLKPLDPNITHFLNAAKPKMKLTKNQINSLCASATILQAGGTVPGGSSYGTAYSSPSDAWPGADMSIPSRRGPALAFAPIDPGATKVGNYAALASIGGIYAACVAAVSAAN